MSLSKAALADLLADALDQILPEGDGHDWPALESDFQEWASPRLEARGDKMPPTREAARKKRERIRAEQEKWS